MDLVLLCLAAAVPAVAGLALTFWTRQKILREEESKRAPLEQALLRSRAKSDEARQQAKAALALQHRATMRGDQLEAENQQLLRKLSAEREAHQEARRVAQSVQPAMQSVEKRAKAAAAEALATALRSADQAKAKVALEVQRRQDQESALEAAEERVADLRRELSELRERHSRVAATLVALGVGPAEDPPDPLSLSQREVAREVLESLLLSADVSAAVLSDARGLPLLHAGDPAAARRGAATAALIADVAAALEGAVRSPVFAVSVRRGFRGTHLIALGTASQFVLAEGPAEVPAITLRHAALELGARTGAFTQSEPLPASFAQVPVPSGGESLERASALLQDWVQRWTAHLAAVIGPHGKVLGASQETLPSGVCGLHYALKPIVERAERDGFPAPSVQISVQSAHGWSLYAAPLAAGSDAPLVVVLSADKLADSSLEEVVEALRWQAFTGQKKVG